MSNENEMKYFCIGLGLGVAAGFLFAPKAGIDTRDYVQKKAEEGVEFVKNEAANAIHLASDAVQRVAALAGAELPDTAVTRVARWANTVARAIVAADETVVDLELLTHGAEHVKVLADLTLV